VDRTTELRKIDEAMGSRTISMMNALDVEEGSPVACAADAEARPPKPTVFLGEYGESFRVGGRRKAISRSLR
jgi:hypothetical protein